MITEVYADKVLIKRAELSKSAYIVPEEAQSEEPLFGEVMYIGTKVKDTKVGDIVVFDQFDHKDIFIEGNILVEAKEETLICKIKLDE